MPRQADRNTEHENHTCHDWNYKVCGKVLLRKDGILHKSDSWYESDPWTITSVHTMGQPGFNPEQNQTN
jgi:hypothetical protein